MFPDSQRICEAGYGSGGHGNEPELKIMRSGETQKGKAQERVIETMAYSRKSETAIL
jgi:hypothetical protein